MPNQPIKYGEMLAEEIERQLKPPESKDSHTFEEVFEAFERWYWDRWRHHPPKMETGAFYEFLKLNGIVK